MTVNAVLDEPEEPSGSSSARQRDAERVVGIIRESFAKIEQHSEGLSRQFYSLLFAIAPETRDMFPANMEVQRSRLLRALVHIVQMVDRPQELTPFLRQLGRDHRKFGVVTKHYESVGTALLGALRHYAGDDWTEEVERAWADAFAIIAGAMQEGSASDDGPAWWQAQVLDHIRLDWETALIRVKPDRDVPFYTGQYVSVETPQRPRLWRYLSPANAPREDGTIDFHVRAVHGGWVSRALVGYTHRGDVWKLGSPLGNLWANPAADRDLLLVGGGTGIAPLLGVIDELSGRETRPYVTMFFGGRTVDDLYYLRELRELAEQHSWLTVVPVTEDGSADGGEKGQLAEVVTGHGAWRDHDVLVSGSPGMIRSTVSRMLVTGTTFDQISYDSFTTD